MCAPECAQPIQILKNESFDWCRWDYHFKLLCSRENWKNFKYHMLERFMVDDDLLFEYVSRWWILFFYPNNFNLMLLLDHTSVNSNFLYFSRLAHNSLKSVEVPPDPVKMSDFEGEQIFSEKVKDVANNLKVVWKRFGENISDLRDKRSCIFS